MQGGEQALTDGVHSDLSVVSIDERSISQLTFSFSVFFSPQIAVLVEYQKVRTLQPAGGARPFRSQLQGSIPVRDQSRRLDAAVPKSVAQSLLQASCR